MSRMIRAAILILTGVAVAVFLRLPPSSPVAAQASEPMPRYQLVAARFTVALQSGDVSNDSVFRLDTQTGRTVLFVTGTTKEGETYGKWIPIAEQ